MSCSMFLTVVWVQKYYDVAVIWQMSQLAFVPMVVDVSVELICRELQGPWPIGGVTSCRGC